MQLRNEHAAWLANPDFGCPSPVEQCRLKIDSIASQQESIRNLASIARMQPSFVTPRVGEPQKPVIISDSLLCDVFSPDSRAYLSVRYSARLSTWEASTTLGNQTAYPKPLPLSVLLEAHIQNIPSVAIRLFSRPNIKTATEEGALNLACRRRNIAVCSFEGVQGKCVEQSGPFSVGMGVVPGTGLAQIHVVRLVRLCGNGSGMVRTCKIMENSRCRALWLLRQTCMRMWICWGKPCKSPGKEFFTE